jgi:hypothetical protein
MRAPYNASAKLNFPAGYPIRFQEIKTDGGACNVNNGIKRAHFVERHILNRCVVNFRLGFGYPRKNVQRANFRAFGNAGLRNEEAYILPFPVNMARVIMIDRGAMRPMPIVRVVMMAMPLSVMVVVMLFVIGDMARIAAEVYYGVESGYPAPPILDKIQLPAIEVELGEFGFEIFRINAEIDQSA